MRPLCVFGYEFARAHREAKKSPPRSRRNGTSNPEWPANVCALFHKLLQDGDVREITCVSVDKPMQSKTPFFVNPLSGIQKDMIGVVGVLLFRTRITLHALMKVHKEC